jgi:alpha-tubulin suppressor-like RCC1 family protein
VPGTCSAFGLGYYHTCAIQPPGTLWCWGRNNDGQLGLGVADIDAHPTPIQVGTDTDWAAVTGGENITCALKTDGSLWCWGGNDDGQLGLGTIDMVQHPNPSRVGTATWAAIAVGEDHVCGIRPDSSLWCWGENTWGQVGDGTSGGNVLTPTRVGSSSDWTEIDLGEDHTCGVRTGGSTWCWGLNTVGQLGDGSRTTSTAPGRVCFPLP